MGPECSRGGPSAQEGTRVLKRGPECSSGGPSAQEGAREFKRGLECSIGGPSAQEGAECSRGARGRVGQGARGALCSRGPVASGVQVLKSDRGH